MAVRGLTASGWPRVEQHVHGRVGCDEKEETETVAAGGGAAAQPPKWLVFSSVSGPSSADSPRAFVVPTAWGSAGAGFG
jgi:hypothetical protein